MILKNPYKIGLPCQVNPYSCINPKLAGLHYVPLRVAYSYEGSLNFGSIITNPMILIVWGRVFEFWNTHLVLGIF